MKRMYCIITGCGAWHKNTPFENQKALDNGWHAARSGTNWCPTHATKSVRRTE